jgi:hypothetical protein
MTRLRFCWSSRIEMVAFLMYDILYDKSRLGQGEPCDLFRYSRALVAKFDGDALTDATQVTCATGRNSLPWHRGPSPTGEFPRTMA